MKKRIVCFGDSNTWGHRASDGERYDEEIRWTGILQRLLGTDYIVVEEGQRGRTTVWDDPVENRMAGLKYLWPCLDSHAPVDLLIIMLGTNDLKPYFAVHPRTIAESAGKLAEMALKCPFGPKGNAPKVLLIAPIRCEYSKLVGHIFNQESEEKSKHFSEEFRQIAEFYGCAFLDASAVAGPDPVDGIHLDAESHASLGRAIYREVINIFSAGKSV